MMSDKQTIILFKSECESNTSYVNQLLGQSFDVICISPLCFEFKNLNILFEKLQHPENYSGTILTSPRCVEAIRQALADADLPKGWMQLHNYAVGALTHNLAKSELQELDTYGKEAGSASKLADFIIETCDYDKRLPFLHASSDLAQDTLLIKLKEAGFQIDTIESYETKKHSDLVQNLDVALKTKNVKFMVFFSPSGVNYVYEYFTLNNASWDQYNLIAIGPSTCRALENKGATVYGTAKYPTKEDLLEIFLPKVQEV